MKKKEPQKNQNNTNNEMIKIQENKQIILFDGICNLCNKSIQKIMSLDKKDIFLYASLDSKTGISILNKFNIDTSKIDSIILYENNKIHSKSSAILKIAGTFGSLWKLLMCFWVIPKPIRDLFYDFVAKNRYKWFGKTESCMIPNEKIRNKFLQ